MAFFKRRGRDGVGIREVMTEAGGTGEGFAEQIGSKEVSVNETRGDAFDRAEQA